MQGRNYRKLWKKCVKSYLKASNPEFKAIWKKKAIQLMRLNKIYNGKI